MTVSGNVDPLLLINKLEKGGKRAELWGPQKGAFPNLNNNQFKNMQFDNLKDVKAQKGGGGGQVPKQIQQMQMQLNQKKGGEEKFMGKDQKTVKFKLDEDFDDEFDEDDDEFDEEDDDDDEFDEVFKAPSKGGHVGHGAPAKKEAAKGDFKVKNGGGKDGGKGKKGGGIDVFLKGILGKASSGKKDGGGKNGKKGEKNKKEDGKEGSKKHGGDGKDGGGNGKGAAKNGGGKGKDGWSKKGGDVFDEGPKMESKQHGFNEMNGNHKGGGGGGRNMDFMGQMGGFPAVNGLPAMNGGGRGQGMGGQGNPYNPQYMAHMMMMNQQRENGHGSYNPNPNLNPMMMNPQRENGYGAYNQMPYARPHPGMGYGPPPQAAGYGPPPPGNDQFTHMFSDENTDSCSIM